MPAKKPQLAKSETIAALPEACANEAAAVAFLEQDRWGKNMERACCAQCGSISVYQIKNRETGERVRYLWRCRDCNRQYTVRTGTVYAESLIPLHKWLRAMWEAASAKNCVSALEMSRRLEVSYKSALFLMHRIRHAMSNGPDTPKLSGTVEADETYVGGKPRLPWNPKGGKGKHQKSIKQIVREKWSAKIPVFAVVERGGEVRARVMDRVTSENLQAALLETVEPSARLMTDQFRGYERVGHPFASHDAVNHGMKQYVIPGTDIHTNTIEGFFSRVKRGINGTFHSVSKDHLHRYVDGFAFIYNTRGMNDGERTLALLKRVEGKRLMYKKSA